jgi:hypothetical protein
MEGNENEKCRNDPIITDDDEMNGWSFEEDFDDDDSSVDSIDKNDERLQELQKQYINFLETMKTQHSDFHEK